MKKNSVINTIIKDITNLASGANYIFLAIIFFLIGGKVIAIQLISGIIIALAIIICLRLIFFKERPKKEKHNTRIEKIAAGTFPSHHSANIGLLTIILIKNFNNIYLAVFMIITSILVLYSRTYLKKHYILDVSIGYAIGIIIGYLI